MNFNDLEKKAIANNDTSNMTDKAVITLQMKIIEELKHNNEQLSKQNKDFLSYTKNTIRDLHSTMEKQNEQIQQFVKTNTVTQIKVKEYTDIYSKIFWGWVILAIFGIAGFFWQINNYKNLNNSIWRIGNGLKIESFMPQVTAEDVQKVLEKQN